jgi:hypothetical protein
MQHSLNLSGAGFACSMAFAEMPVWHRFDADNRIPSISGRAYSLPTLPDRFLPYPPPYRPAATRFQWKEVQA